MLIKGLHGEQHVKFPLLKILSTVCELILGNAIKFPMDYPEQVAPFFDAVGRSGIVKNMVIHFEDEQGN